MWRHLLVGVSFALLTTACEVNLFESVASKEGDDYWLEEARIQIDNQDYEAALSALGKVERDTNDLRLVRSAAKLGQSGLSLWSILLNAVDGSNYSNAGSTSGTDQIFNELSSAVVGTGETRTARILALTDAINELLAAPDPSASRVRNMSCFLAGVMALPTAEDSTTTIQNTTTSLSAIAATTDVSNPQATCPDTSALVTNLASLATIQQRFNLILSATSQCTFLSTASGTLNAIETQLKKLSSKADKGCSATPTCASTDTACKALGLTCVYKALTADGAVSKAQDGAVSSCELVQNCLDPTQCF